MGTQHLVVGSVNFSMHQNSSVSLQKSLLFFSGGVVPKDLGSYTASVDQWTRYGRGSMDGL